MNETPAPSETRLGFRLVAGLLALLMIGVGVTSLSPFSVRNAISGVSMIVFGFQFVYAAVTGHWFTFGGTR